jgi:hypothetical protein
MSHISGSGKKDADGLFLCCEYRIKNINLYFTDTPFIFKCCNETRLKVMLSALYIYTIIITDYGQFVYKLSNVARCTAKVKAM